MPYCYYTCNLLPLELLTRSGYTPRWLGRYLRDAAAPIRRDALSVPPMTCPYVTKLVAAADELLAGEPGSGAAAGGAPKNYGASPGDRLVVPGGCDAARRMGDMLAATYPGRVFALPMPRSSGPDVMRTLAADLHKLESWLGARLPEGAAQRSGETDASDEAARGSKDLGYGPGVGYPAAPQPGGVFVVAGPLTDDSLLRLIERLGAHVSGLESCTSPDRWKPLAVGTGAATGDSGRAAPGTAPDTPVPNDHATLAARLLTVGMCPRRSTVSRRDHLLRRLDESRPSSIIYARQSFCDPGAYDALLVAKLAEERGLPYLEIEVDFPFDANGPLRTRVEAFLEAQSLDDDLLGELNDDDLFDDRPGDHPGGGSSSGTARQPDLGSHNSGTPEEED
jgi:hypothetical protein